MYAKQQCKYINKHKAVGALIAGVSKLGKIVTIDPGVGVAPVF